ncbi:MAG: lipoate--protein ligase [Planctomycetes bacterium]|nr:lipoate--protein ligase [Planctomycetota bacterium]
MEAWRLVVTWGADPAFNMGLDEALLEAEEAPPTLRLYSWSPDTLSLGYFQSLADVPGREQARALVRRITGGGAIHHVRELTFSIAARLDHPLYRGATRESYQRVHSALADALRAAGVDAVPRGATTLESDRSGTGMCFHASTPLDLAWDGRKGVGTAQRRRRGRVLHHGSIKIGGSALETGVATLPGGPTPAELGELVVAAFAARFELAFQRAVPEPAERVRARELGARYLDPDFVAAR